MPNAVKYAMLAFAAVAALAAPTAAIGEVGRAETAIGLDAVGFSHLLAGFRISRVVAAEVGGLVF